MGRLALAAAALLIAILAGRNAPEGRGDLFVRHVPDEELTTGSIQRRASAVDIPADLAIRPPARFVLDRRARGAYQPFPTRVSDDEAILARTRRPDRTKRSPPVARERSRP